MKGLRALKLAATGRIKSTGYGDLIVLKADGARPVRASYDTGITYLDTVASGFESLTGWVWIEGPDWEAMVNCSPGRAMTFGDIIGGVQDKKAVA